MGSSILGIGQSALTAAQVGLATTGHNIANAATPGYNRQIVIQASAGGQDLGFGFVGKGTEVTDIQRAYNQFLTNQVISAQTSKGQLDTYYTQISRINNQFADADAGLSPALQSFFKGLQDVASDPNASASRESALSNAQSLASRFQSLDGQLSDMRQNVNNQLTSTIGMINVYAEQLSSLNKSIEAAQGTTDSHAANDLLDQRDQVISQLSKEVQVSVVKQGNSYNVFIGSGQPLVVGNNTYGLVPTVSPTDAGRVEVGYVTNGVMKVLPENALPGGTLGGLFEFRAKTLDSAQNALGRVAIGLASTFNAQHRLGQDQNGAMGGDFFTVAAPVVTSNVNNTGTALATASISNAGALTTSDYRLQVVGPGSYKVTRLSDGNATSFATFPQTIDGVDFNMSAGTQATGDDFVIKPTVAGAANFNVAITDRTKIAVAAPIRTAALATNTGTGKISAGSVDGNFTPANVTPAVTLTYNSTTNEFTGFPLALGPVTVTNNGTSTTFAAGTPVTYTPGATITAGGASFAITGTPANGDKFTLGANTNGLGDNRNALLLGSLQSKNTLDNGTTSYQGAYSQLVNQVGNKTRELGVTSAAEGKLLTQAVASQQSVSGVNLDEEATNLIRYQQAYQAAGKLMQTANSLFDVLLQLGN